MSQFDDPSPFNDPLAQAIKSACGRERAPEHLRQAVTRLGSAPAEPAWRTWWASLAQIPARTALVAAATLVAIGFAAYQIRQTFFPSLPGGMATYVVELPDHIAGAIVARHERCLALSDHHLVAGNDMNEIEATLSAQLGIPVTTVAIHERLKFEGAGRCQVGEVLTGHLLVSRDGHRVSVFSMPASVLGYTDSNVVYEQVVGEHGLNGFTTGPGLYCVVGSAESRALAKELFHNLQARMCSPGSDKPDKRDKRRAR